MSLRLIKKTRRTHELADGRIIQQMMGAEGEGDPADEDTENDTEDGDEDEDSEDEDGDAKSKSKTTDDSEVLRKRMKAADRRAAAAEAKLREKELEGKTELEQTKAKLEQAEALNTELNDRLQTLQRERSFLGSNTVTWHDPEIAMSKLNWDALIDEDGDVDGAALDKAIKALAKEKPFLVKKEVVEGGDDNGPANGGQPSGSKVGSGKKQTKADLDRAALEKKYPALRI